MAHICYAIQGEGRGHATRGRAIVELLRDRGHRVTLFTSGQALELLRASYTDTEVEVHAIPGVAWAYRADRSVDYARTFSGAVPFMARLDKLSASLGRTLEHLAPDLLVTDFEPAMPRAACRIGLPFMSVDHQHVLTAADLSALPVQLRAWVAFLRPFVGMWHGGEVEQVVSSFFWPGPRRGQERVVPIGVLLRPEVLDTRPEVHDHLLVYVRRHAPQSLLDALRGTGLPIRIYGLGERRDEGRVQFCPVSIDGFLEDLATCRGLVCTAGNQLIGEALHLRKPVFAMPEGGNHEQMINAWFIARSPWGMTAPIDRVDSLALRRFVRDLEALRVTMDPLGVAGNQDAVDRIEANLPLSARGVPHAARPVAVPAGVQEPAA
ncbi:MAG: teichoic acid biosynthesis protein [Alphaproteobacteria bacterium]|nr:teichoic acid biosynthesis protein [Alphaproteobacteria bacterium]